MISKKEKEKLKAKTELMIIDLMTAKKKTRGEPLGLYIHNAQRELAELLKHL